MRGHQPGYRYEFLDDDAAAGPLVDAPIDPVAPSEQGAGPLGFGGTVRKEAVAAAGLATLAGDEFGSGPAVPMVPGTWQPDEPGAGGGGRR
jgi:PPE-repeat protein